MADLRCSLSVGFISFLAVSDLPSLYTTLMTQLSRWEILTTKLRQTQLVSQMFFAEQDKFDPQVGGCDYSLDVNRL